MVHVQFATRLAMAGVEPARPLGQRILSRLSVVEFSELAHSAHKTSAADSSGLFKVMAPRVGEALPTRSASTTRMIIFLHVVKGHEPMTSYAPVAPIMPLADLNLVGLV